MSGMSREEVRGYIRVGVILVVIILLGGILGHGVKDEPIKDKRDMGEWKGNGFDNCHIKVKVGYGGSVDVYKGKKEIMEGEMALELRDGMVWDKVCFDDHSINALDGGFWHLWKSGFVNKSRGLRGAVGYWQKNDFEKGGLLYAYLVMRFEDAWEWKVRWNYKLNMSYDSVEVYKIAGRYVERQYNGSNPGYLRFEDATGLWIWKDDRRVVGLVWKDEGYELKLRGIDGKLDIELVREGRGEELELRGPDIGNVLQFYEDTDDDGVPDDVELRGWDVLWHDVNSELEYRKVSSNREKKDTDGDGLSDLEEWLLSGTAPDSNDTDSDGAGDYEEFISMHTNARDADTDDDWLEDGREYYTKVYEYSKRVRVDGSEHIDMNVREDECSRGLKDAQVIVGVRGNLSVNVELLQGHNITGVGEFSSMGYMYWSRSVRNYIGKIDTDVRVNVKGKGWVETVKVILVERSDPHSNDTDGDGLSDGYEVQGWSGYVTSPVSNDTDGDGVSDRMEEHGWKWSYATKHIYPEKNGFHTNPVSNDTDGDGCEDGEDAEPLANIVLKMSLNRYVWNRHPDYTKFVGFYTSWKLGEKGKSYEYYTEHKDYTKNLHGYTYWVDVPDSVYTHVSVMAAAFYNDWGDKNITNVSKHTVADFDVMKGYRNDITVEDTENECTFSVTYELVSIERVRVVGIYNESMVRWDSYIYKGKYYVLYVNNTGEEWYAEDRWGFTRELIAHGLNVILVPDALFVNSELYRHIKNNNTTALLGDNSSIAKMGAMGNATMPVHIVGMFFLEIYNGSNIEKLLYLLTHNESGAKFGGYIALDPNVANLPVDIPLNSPLSYCAVLNDMVGESLSLFFLNVLQSSSKIL